MIILVTQIKDTSKRLNALVRLYSDMEQRCHSTYFPITQEIVDILVEECFKLIEEHARVQEWKLAFKKV